MGWIGRRAALITADVLISYFAFFVAIVIRFFANGRFLPEAHIYLEPFNKFAPYYAVITVVIYALFGLYSSIWKYAGFNDLIRIIGASLVTSILQLLGTRLLFMRMPTTYYFLGAFIQFALVSLLRFAYRICAYLFEKHTKGRLPSVNVLLVGAGDTANYIFKHLEGERGSNIRVKITFSENMSVSGSIFNGVPIFSDLGKFADNLKNYDITGVCLADPYISSDTLKAIRNICLENDIELDDYTSALFVSANSVSFNKLARCSRGSVRIVQGETTVDFSSGTEALVSFPGNYVVKNISAENGFLKMWIASNNIEKNDINAEWVKNTESETGEQLSFF